MERRRHLEAQVRQLKRELPRQPWLFARLADLLLAAGRTREAAAHMRRGGRSLEDYPSSWMVQAEIAEREGDVGRAESLRERACASTPGIHAAWVQRLGAAREDSIRHLELLQQAWELDQFSPQLNLESEKAGLRRAVEYEQALRPTAVEAARREEQFRRLLEQYAKAGQPAEGPTPAMTEPEEIGTPDEFAEHSEEEAGGVSAAPLHGAAQRDQTLLEQAERLASLTRPLHLPASLPEDPARRVGRRARDLFDPRSMMTRRLARIYLDQGYPALALGAIEALLLREPGAQDLGDLAHEAREAESRLAATPSPQRRRPS